MNSFQSRIDQLHAKNHTWCSTDFFADSYKDRATLALNSQAGEQSNNSVLSKIKTQLLYSKASNGISLIAIAIALNNKAKFAKFEADARRREARKP